MAEGKNTIIVYRDWKAVADALSPEQFGLLMKHFFDFVNDLDPVLTDPVLKMAWIPIEQTLKRDYKKWKEKSSKNSDNAKLRWEKERIRTHTDASERVRSDANDAVSVSVSVSGNDSVKEAIKKPAKPNKSIILDEPSLEEFLEYAKEKLSTQIYEGIETDLELKFHSWKENNWWTSGKHSRAIKNWKTTLLNTLKHMIKDFKESPKKYVAQKTTASSAWKELINNKNHNK